MAIKIQKLVASVLEIAALPKTTVCAEGTLKVSPFYSKEISIFTLPRPKCCFNEQANVTMPPIWREHNISPISFSRRFGRQGAVTASPHEVWHTRYAHVAARHCLNSVWSIANGLNRRRALQTKGVSLRKDTEEHHLPLLCHSRWQPGIWDIQNFVLVPAAKELAGERFGLSPKQEAMLWKQIISLGRMGREQSPLAQKQP